MCNACGLYYKLHNVSAAKILSIIQNTAMAQQQSVLVVPATIKARLFFKWQSKDKLNILLQIEESTYRTWILRFY